MKFETVKTFILILLIGTSLLLTFALWTYQQNDTPLNNDELVNEVHIGGTEERRSTMILPSTIVFHYYDGNYGFEDPSFQHEFFNELQSRSEEHTSELQSRGQIVCRLLLEKKIYQ